MDKPSILFLIDNTTIYSHGKIISCAFTQLGYRTRVLDFNSKWSMIEDTIKTFKPDVVFSIGVRHTWMSKRIKDTGCKLVYWYPDAYFIFDNRTRDGILEVLTNCDKFITTMRGHVEAAKNITNKVVWIPAFFSYDYYTLTGNRPDHPAIDICFIGNKHSASPQRAPYMETIRKLIPANIWWIGHGGWYKPILNGPKVAQILQESKIGLNFISGGPLNCDLQHSVRIFTVMGCGAMLLTERIPNMDDLFIDGIHLVQFDGVTDLVDKSVYYLHNTDAREKIAKVGQKLVLQKHTLKNRLIEFEKVINEIVCVKA